MSGADYVLRRPPKGERSVLDVAVEQAADALEDIVRQGAEMSLLRRGISPRLVIAEQKMQTGDGL